MSGTLSLLSRLEPAVFAGFMAVLVWAPLPFGSNRPWAAAVLCALVGSLLCAWICLKYFGRAQLGQAVWQHGRWPLCLLLLVQLCVLLQLVPLPADWVGRLSPKAASWQPDVASLPLSLDPWHTRFQLIQGLMLCQAYFLVLALVNSPRRLEWLLLVLVASGTLQALYGAAMVLTGWELGFLVEKYSSYGSATGTFVNRNHLAGYLVICLAAGIALQLSRTEPLGGYGWRQRLGNLLHMLLSSTFRLRVYLAIMLIGLVMTRSRMGNVAFFAGVGVAALLALWSGRRFSSRMVLFLASLLIIDVLLLGQWFGFDGLLMRIQATELGSEQRLASSAVVFEVVRDFYLTGTGAGSFYSVFPNYQPSGLPGFYEHAHNDYLEFMLELGVPATLLLGMFLMMSLWSAWRVQVTRRSPLYRGTGFAIVLMSVWLLLHSATDFNLQIPANALSIVVLMALAAVVRALPAAAGVSSVRPSAR